jgi:AcrR family transcriptional regulator
MSKQRSAEDWVQAATRALAAQGIDAVRVERLAADLGVTKGSFYWHFADLAALRAAVLATWEARATTEIIERVEERGGDAADKLRRLGEIVFGGEGALERQVRAWAAQDMGAAAAQDRVDQRRIAYVEGLFEEAGLPAETAAVRALFLYQALVGQFTLGKRRALGSEAVADIAGLLLTKPRAAARRRSGQ